MKPRYFITCFLCAIVAYPLSIGPAIWICAHTPLPESVLIVIYRPLLDANAKPSIPLQRYLELWGWSHD